MLDLLSQMHGLYNAIGIVGLVLAQCFGFCSANIHGDSMHNKSGNSNSYRCENGTTSGVKKMAIDFKGLFV